MTEEQIRRLIGSLRTGRQMNPQPYIPPRVQPMWLLNPYSNPYERHRALVRR